MSHRLAAADQLGQRLKRRIAENPSDPHVLIGHSHGGSVIAYCLQRHQAVLNHLAGAAFLATPFVDIRARPGWRADARALCIGFAGIVCVAVAPQLKPVLSRLTPQDLWDGWNELITVGALLVCGVALFAVAWRASDALIKLMQVRIAALAGRYGTSVLPTGPHYLFARSPGDEAAEGCCR